MTRDEIQSNAVELSKLHNNLLLAWCTSMGKTKASLDIISKLDGRGYIILAETSHKKNWIEEIIKHGHEDVLARCDIFLYASLHKYKNTKVDWIIFDEIHHGLSDKRKDIISTISSKNNILLTATIDNDQLFSLKNMFHKLYRNHISLRMAIDWGIIPAPEINLIPVELKSSGYTEILTINKGLKDKRIKKECHYNDRWKILKQYKDIELSVKCTQLQKYSWYEEQMEYWKKQYFIGRKAWQKNKWLQLGSERKRFLAEIKTPYAIGIVTKLRRDKKRFICFTGSINQSEILGSDNNVVHSKNNNNQQIIDLFNREQKSSLFAVNMLQEGVNLKNIEVGVIVQLDGKLRSYTQRAGRIFRANKPIQYIIYVKNTRDQEFLENAISDLKSFIYYG